MEKILEIFDASEVFEYNGNFYQIKNEPYESRETFLERVWYILLHLTDNNFEDVVRQSRIWANVKINNCGYDFDVVV